MTSRLRSTLILALLALPLAAQSGRDRHPRIERVGRALNLTEAQKSSLRAIRDNHHPDLILRRDAVRHARIDLQTALQDASTSEARLRALYDKASAARFDLILARRSLRTEIQAVLTPEQRALAREMRHRARARIGGRSHHRTMDTWMVG
jgi:Spy/CpxP family protein refolding chaperone